MLSTVHSQDYNGYMHRFSHCVLYAVLKPILGFCMRATCSHNVCLDFLCQAVFSLCVCKSNMQYYMNARAMSCKRLWFSGSCASFEVYCHGKATIKKIRYLRRTVKASAETERIRNHCKNLRRNLHSWCLVLSWNPSPLEGYFARYGKNILCGLTLSLCSWVIWVNMQQQHYW